MVPASAATARRPAVEERLWTRVVSAAHPVGINSAGCCPFIASALLATKLKPSRANCGICKRSLAHCSPHRQLSSLTHAHRSVRRKERPQLRICSSLPIQIKEAEDALELAVKEAQVVFGSRLSRQINEVDPSSSVLWRVQVAAVALAVLWRGGGCSLAVLWRLRAMAGAVSIILLRVQVAAVLAACCGECKCSGGCYAMPTPTRRLG